YLDITKSVIISSPAGSGKTEKLARRYVSLLLGGSEIEKILAITFTEKAAAEMKERILRILEKENPELFLAIQEKIPLMRISTIHSFCLKLLKRFSIELGLDPSLDVMDEFNASLLWSESVYESLIEEKNSPDLFFEMMRDRGIKGWDSLFRILNELHSRRPYPELILKENHPVEREEEKRILELYSRCLKRYTDKKLERHLIDFDDLELLTYEALIKNPEWQNILYSFDEHTDHILVDEFQDTSSLQWKIIDKLTEEWRSGIGAKRDSGKIPTIFLVGDEKQSIYLFRGANVSVFQEAKERFSDWLGREYYFEEIRENYRSLPAIINFTNSLFERLMPPDPELDSGYESWHTRYAPFEATRQGNGRVELILIEGAEHTKENREREAVALAKRIQSLVGHYEISDGDIKRPCIYGDIAILLRKRRHLCIFEDALRREGIPFIIVKGIGFYDEPEVAVLRELLSLIIDPMDDYSLFCVLRSPLFGIDYRTLFRLIDKGNRLLIEKIQSAKNKKVKEAFNLISSWVERSRYTPLALLLEDALSDTGGWSHYWEKQRYANIKKFIRLIEQYESQGFSILDIREKLIKARLKDEAKANINTEGMNAVKIMTVHAAKGLQFPMVFLPSLDEDNVPRSGPIVIDEEGERISIAYEEDSTKRKKIEPFLKRKEKELEEEKRLFYVAVTRARDFLCMFGAVKKEKPPTGRLAYITDNFEHLPSLKVITASEVDELYFTSHFSPLTSHLPSEPFMSEPIYIEPISYEPPLKWRDVTEDVDIRVKHGEDWVLLGKVFHTLFEELSKGIIGPDEVDKNAFILLSNETVTKKDIGRLMEIIKKDFEKLETSGYLKDVVLPIKDSYTELPFILQTPNRSGLGQKRNTVFRGRIDRIIIKKRIAIIYDYKTFPVREKELPELIDKYRFQMDIYRSAAEKILSIKTKSYILFTHIPLLIEVRG
ncbi:MAG: UvrD-helicase domain-containing protein, partial [Nitrospirae bacterium]|nr:UvrD-helicase domain-containing protein [Nitrospirota bacterium]